MDKCILTMLILMLLCGAFCASAAQVPLKRMKYGVGQWPEAGRGNHRAVIKVDTASDAVRVRIPWRRRDSYPETKDILVYDSATGKKLANVARIEIKQEYGDIAFGPVTASGTYEVYYLPYNPGQGNFDDAGTYFPPKDTSDPEWLKSNGLSADAIASGKWNSLPEAQVFELQARNDFNRFDPMEIVATPDEVQTLLEKTPGTDCIIFTEDRKFPIRMMDHLPLKWIDEGPRDAFSGTAQPGEFYVFQIGVWAARSEITDLKLSKAALKSSSGEVIPESKMTCINLEGTDWLGRPMKKTVKVSKGAIQPMWVGVQIPKTASGTFTGELTLSSVGMAARKIPLSIEVSGPALQDAGDSDLWRFSRLRWLNSTMGIDDDVIPPFTPLKKQGNKIACVGRVVKFGSTGLPASITSNGREILTAPVSMIVETSAGKSVWKKTSGKTLKEKPWTVEQENNSAASNLNMGIWSRMEADGVITYKAEITAKKDTNVKNLKLQVPIARDVATYLMGFSRKGGYRPPSLKWKWSIDRTDNMVWIGDADAGIQVKLCEDVDIWDYNFKENGLPESWNNKGKGGCDVTESGNTVLVNAYTGPRTIAAGEKLTLKFRFMVTPFKPIDSAHWNWRYGPAEAGGNIFHLHHATTENPYINYPFITADRIKALAQTVRGNGTRQVDFGSLVYPAMGNIKTDKGSMHVWARVNFDSTVVAPQQSRFNKEMFTLKYPDGSNLGLYWNIDDHGMRAYIYDVSSGGAKHTMVMPTSSPEWTKGSKALITLSWGDKIEIFVDGKLKGSQPFNGIIVRPLENAVLNFTGGFALDAVKISDVPYVEGQPITPTVDDHTLLLDTFSNLKPKSTLPEKIAKGTGKINGAIIADNDDNGKSVEFSSKTVKADIVGLNLYYTVRELTNYVHEMWPLRSLGDEIFQTRETFVYSVEKTMFGQSGGGYPWLQEHLVNGYVPGWRQPLPDGETDAAIGTKGLSRWHNYYVQGMDWLMKNTGIDGLYLDGIGYDREIMKRIAKTMYRANPKSRVNFHSGNNYDFMDMRISPANQYMEHFPYMTNLWFGEMYDYNQAPDYWLTEISGIPFGLTSEMLNYENGGNAYRGMIYGMTGRQHASAPAMWKFWDEFGIQKTRMLGYWSGKCPVKTNNSSVLATVYKKQGKSLIALAHWQNAAKRVRESVVAKPLTIAPVINGRVDPEQWTNAAGLSGFKKAGSDRLADQQTQVWVTCDSENMYVAFRCHTNGQKLKASHTTNGEALWEDDSLEFFIQPDLSKQDYYQFIGNSIGAYFTGFKIGKSWNPKAIYKTSVGDRNWDGEIVIPLSDLGVTSLNGKVIGFNVCRDQQTPDGGGNSWNQIASGYHDVGAFGRIEFSETKAPVQQALPGAAQKAESKKAVPVKLSIDWKALGIDPKTAKLTAPEIPGFQGGAVFSPKDEIPVAYAGGWLLVLE